MCGGGTGHYNHKLLLGERDSNVVAARLVITRGSQQVAVQVGDTFANAWGSTAGVQAAAAAAAVEPIRRSARGSRNHIHVHVHAWGLGRTIWFARHPGRQARPVLMRHVKPCSQLIFLVRGSVGRHGCGGQLRMCTHTMLERETEKKKKTERGEMEVEVKGIIKIIEEIVYKGIIKALSWVHVRALLETYVQLR